MQGMQDTDLGSSHTDDLTRKKAGFNELYTTSTILLYSAKRILSNFVSLFLRKDRLYSILDILFNLKTTLRMAHTTLHDRPSVINSELKYRHLLEQVKHNFASKNLPADVVNGLEEFTADTYNALIFDKKYQQADDFLNQIITMQEILDTITDKRHLQRMAIKARNRIRSIKKVRADNKAKESDSEDRKAAQKHTEDTYLEGQLRFFAAWYNYLTSPFIKDQQITETQNKLLDLLKMDENHMKMAA